MIKREDKPHINPMKLREWEELVKNVDKEKNEPLYFAIELGENAMIIYHTMNSLGYKTKLLDAFNFVRSQTSIDKCSNIALDKFYKIDLISKSYILSFANKEIFNDKSNSQTL